MSATTTQLLSSGEFCKLYYDTIPVNSASANISLYTNNSKMQNFELWHSSQMSDMTNEMYVKNWKESIVEYFEVQ